MALSKNGDDEDVDELAQGMIDAAQVLVTKRKEKKRKIGVVSTRTKALQIFLSQPTRLTCLQYRSEC